MFADDLTLITQASRSAARNIHLCLSIYSDLTGQRPNLLKSKIYFPSWLNSHIAKRICCILNLNQVIFPFTCLGILISPKRLASLTFQPMVNKIRHTASRWANFHLSPAAKCILINYVLLSVPVYKCVCIPSLIQSSLLYPKSWENSSGVRIEMERASILRIGKLLLKVVWGGLRNREHLNCQTFPYVSVYFPIFE